MLSSQSKVRWAGVVICGATSVGAALLLVFNLITPRAIVGLQTTELVGLLALLVLPAAGFAALKRVSQQAAADHASRTTVLRETTWGLTVLVKAPAATRSVSGSMPQASPMPAAHSVPNIAHAAVAASPVLAAEPVPPVPLVRVDRRLRGNAHHRRRVHGDRSIRS